VSVVYPTPPRHRRAGAAGNARAFTDAPIYARASGYLKKWHVDIGSRVTQGQLLAEIETPELDQQLRQAAPSWRTRGDHGDVARPPRSAGRPSQARRGLRQETDEKLSDYNAKKATVESNAANVSGLEDLQASRRSRALRRRHRRAQHRHRRPHRRGRAQARELFRLAAIDKLRCLRSVPQCLRPGCAPGTPTVVTPRGDPDKVLPGTWPGPPTPSIPAPAPC
jgi:multidrug efflux pump subunit AcrA (membrane-fusion protein)